MNYKFIKKSEISTSRKNDNIPETDQLGPSGHHPEKKNKSRVADVISEENKNAFLRMIEETRKQDMAEWIAARDAYCKQREIRAVMILANEQALAIEKVQHHQATPAQACFLRKF